SLYFFLSLLSFVIFFLSLHVALPIYPAIFVLISLKFAEVSRLMPEFPCLIFSHSVSVSWPSGETVPVPVTTTLRFTLITSFKRYLCLFYTLYNFLTCI